MRAGLTEEDIALIYDTAVDRSLWPKLLERLADAVGGTVSTIGFREIETDRVTGTFVRTDPAVYSDYARYPYASNPLNASAWAPVGGFVTDEQQVPRDRLVKTDYYRDFLRPNRIGPVLTGVLCRDARSRWTLNVSRPLGADDFGAAELEETRRFSPHLVRMVAVSSRLREAEITARTAEAALDELPSGIILLDGLGKIRFANREAQAIAAARDGLVFSTGGVAADRTSDTAMIARAVGQALLGEGASFRLPRPSGGRPLAVLVVPLRQEADWLGAVVPRALIVVTDPERGHVPPEQRLARLYGLTPTEAGIAVQLLGGSDLAEIAERRRISVPTARLHLHRILAKTGTARQTELVQRMLRESLGVR